MPNTITQEVNGYTRILTLTPPFDKRNDDPEKNYGIHGMNLRCILLKDNRAVQFIAYTGLHLQHVSDELFHADNKYNSFKGMGADVGYHSPTPMYEGQMALDCDLLECEKCYYDGSSLRAEEWYTIFLNEGIDKIWELLEADWKDRFGDQI